MPKFKCDKCGTEYKTPYCPNCGDKRTSKDEEMMTDTEILVDVLNDATKVVVNKGKKLSMNTLMTMILFLLAFIFFFTGIFYKNVYYNNDDNKVNAYVEDDGLNYLINSNYFTGYMSLAGLFTICGSLFATANRSINNKQKK